jgi:hypothetical protein
MDDLIAYFSEDSEGDFCMTIEPRSKIVKAWLEWTGQSEFGIGGASSELRNKWKAFLAGWKACECLNKMLREQLQHLRDTEADRDRYRDELNKITQRSDKNE